MRTTTAIHTHTQNTENKTMQTQQSKGREIKLLRFTLTCDNTEAENKYILQVGRQTKPSHFKNIWTYQC